MVSFHQSANWRALLRFLGGIALYFLLVLPCFWYVHLEKGLLQIAWILMVLVLDGLAVVWVMRTPAGKWLGLLAWLFWGAAVTLVILFTQYRGQLGCYRGASLQSDFFAGKHVLVFVPHQDDDINLVQGMIELYTDSGSQVSMVFSTNGDSGGVADIRLEEAVQVAGFLGISEENVYFLGYGDQWQSMEFGGQTVAHIYNSPQEDALWTSVRGLQNTYGNELRSSYEDRSYTRANYVGSIQRLIEKLRPDVIYATDYDAHGDHRALSLLVEEALGEILKKDAGYRPEVYKGFCYRTAWTSVADYADCLNILSTKEFNTDNTLEMDIPFYPWQERIRHPVRAAGLNRFVTQSDGYRFLDGYASQDAASMAARIVNGDKVFWKRSTDSLLYPALIRVDGADTALLNDFKLMDSRDIMSNTADAGIQKISGIVSVSLPQAAAMEALALYDDPSGESQILRGVIRLDNGEEIPFGPLNDNGTATVIPISRQTAASFTIQVDSFRGPEPGLTEIEAYVENPETVQSGLQYFMFQDADENFVYDYCVESPETKFTLYTYPHALALEDSDFEIVMSGSKRCSYDFREGVLTISCPKFAKAVFTIQSAGTTCTLSVSNPGILMRWVLECMQAVDFDLIHCEEPFGVSAQINYYRSLLDKVCSLIA